MIISDSLFCCHTYSSTCRNSSFSVISRWYVPCTAYDLITKICFGLMCTLAASIQLAIQKFDRQRLRFLRWFVSLSTICDSIVQRKTGPIGNRTSFVRSINDFCRSPQLPPQRLCPRTLQTTAKCTSRFRVLSTRP